MRPAITATAIRPPAIAKPFFIASFDRSGRFLSLPQSFANRIQQRPAGIATILPKHNSAEQVTYAPVESDWPVVAALNRETEHYRIGWYFAANR